MPIQGRAWATAPPQPQAAEAALAHSTMAALNPPHRCAGTLLSDSMHMLSDHIKNKLFKIVQRHCLGALVISAGLCVYGPASTVQPSVPLLNRYGQLRSSAVAQLCVYAFVRPLYDYIVPA